MAEEVSVVFDLGSHSTRAGFADEQVHRVEFPTVIGRWKQFTTVIGCAVRNEYIGDEAVCRRGVLNLAYPVRKGTVGNWDDFEKVWFHAFYNELRVAPEERGLLLAQSPTAANEQREKTLQVAFEAFNVPRFYLCNQAELAVLSRGLATALVVDSGEGRTVSVPVSDGYALPYATMQTDIGGSEVTDALVELLAARDICLTTKAERKIVEEIKGKLGYVSMHSEQELSAVQQLSYELPDGSVIPVSEERCLCTEVLFNPAFLKPHLKSPSPLTECLSVPSVVLQSLQRCEIDLRSRLHRCLVVAGGSSLFPNFSARLIQDLRIPSEADVTSVSIGKYGVWTGGAILASLKSFDSAWVMLEEYNEWGPAVIYRK